MSVRQLRATRDSSLKATLEQLSPLHYARGADASEDQPAHVRAASGVRRWQGRLVMVQDDALILALRDDSGAVTPMLLPPGADGLRIHDTTRGTKGEKMDLEACVTLPDGRFVAFGSGSTDRRERLVAVAPGQAPIMRDGHAMYAAMRELRAFCGSELNVEGAVIVDGKLRLFQRGNGAVREDQAPAHASGDFDLARWVTWLDQGGELPPMEAITRYDLGRIEGVAYGFTDAATLAKGRVAFLAAAEASADTYQDGAVLGCIFGIIEGDHVRTCEITVDGHSVVPKLEGIELLAESDGALSFAVVADVDAPDVPALYGVLRVSGG